MTVSRQLQTTDTPQKLVESLYQCPGQPRQWAAFLEQLVQMSNSRSARLLVLDREATQVQSSIKYNIDDGCHDQYVRHYVNTCPWRPELGRFPEGRLYSTFLDFRCKQPDYYETEFFNDWARAQDIHHGVCGTVYQNAEQKVQLLVQRTRNQGHFSHADTDFYNGLVPHLQRVITLQRQLEAVEVKAAALCNAHQASPLPLALLDHAGRVNYVSSQAEQMLAGGHGLQVRNGRLEVSTAPATQQRLEQHLAACVASGRGKWDRAGGWFRVERAQGGSLDLLVMPLHPDLVHPHFSGTRAFAAVFLHDRAARISLCADTLRALYGITTAETKLLQALVGGETLETYAKTRARSLHTVKTQLKSLFRKTGTDRQAALVSLILKGPAGLREQTPPFHL